MQYVCCLCVPLSHGRGAHGIKWDKKGKAEWFPDNVQAQLADDLRSACGNKTAPTYKSVRKSWQHLVAQQAEAVKPDAQSSNSTMVASAWTVLDTGGSFDSAMKTLNPSLQTTDTIKGKMSYRRVSSFMKEHAFHCQPCVFIIVR